MNHVIQPINKNSSTKPVEIRSVQQGTVYIVLSSVCVHSAVIQQGTVAGRVYMVYHETEDTPEPTLCGRVMIT